MNIQKRIQAVFLQRFGSYPEFLAHAPGRVNLLGEHVDYNDGFVLPAAIDRDTWIAFRKSGSPHCTLLALDLGEETLFDRQSILNKQDSSGAELFAWARYPAGMMWSLNSNGLDTLGIEAVFASDVPRGAGLSSSASVEMAFGVAWEELGSWSIPPIKLAKIGLEAEVHYVGLNCGIMDQFTSACGMMDRILFLDCRSLQWKTVSLPSDIVIVIADTTVRRSLTNSFYNERHASCEEALRILQNFLPEIRALRDVDMEQFNQFCGHLPTTTAKRAFYIIEEISRTKKAFDLLTHKDIAGFGKLMNACHTGLRDYYEVSCPELNTMAEIAQSLPGCYGARLTGAGFGGCTVNLVKAQAASTFTRDLAVEYQQKTGLEPEIYICRASDGASVDRVQLSP
jgi:galactokinase